MKLSASCMGCMIKRQEEMLRAYEDEDKKSDYLKKVLKLVCDAPEDVSAPVVTEKISALHEEYFGKPYSFRELKHQYNGLMLAKENELAAKIAESNDPLLYALRLARVGNYIDFGAMGSISEEKLYALLAKAEDDEIDAAEYTAFCENLSKASRLTYCVDNCGEVVLDKLFLTEIQRQYPQLSCTVLVRGKEVLNDITMEDAEEVGLPALARVVGNGTQIAGTDLKSINAEAREAMENADVIISKGQGNFETLHGCGLNIYYLFLCKCDWFTRRFGLEQFKGVFVNEKNQHIQ